MEIIKNPKFDFIGKRKIAYIFSLVVIIWGMVVFGMRGKDNFGVDFVGGDMLNIEFQQSVTPSELRNRLKDINIGSYSVQTLGTEGKRFIIKSGPGTSEKILKALETTYGADFSVKEKSSVSPSMSVSLRKKALYSFFIGLIGILLYLTIRFEFRFAVGATLAIFHDMLFVVAVLALTKKQIDASVIAALLTIAGYSANDTVVIFDRIRENIRKIRSDDYISLFNKSINETLSRTILTVLTTIFIVIIFFFIGGETLHTFAFSLLVGFITGTYSSVFIASAIVIEWHRWKPHKIKV
ncbi:MAG: protein translocase subunit SecF [Candidatus Ratteibacteria bacterium]|nr:protein translocase subunit SecF [Candidatus Ratteibacteria bacterium]